MLLSVVLSTVRTVAGGGAFADSAMAGLWRGLTFMPATLFFIAGFAGMCLMGWLGSHMDKSARSNWIEELINTAAQLAILAGVVIVYFGMSYQPGDTAAAALEDTGNVKVTETEDYILFDGAGTEDALVFYPGARVEAAAYSPLMMRLAENGTDCFLCRMKYNFAMLDAEAAEDVRAAAGNNNYRHWYLGGHSLGGVTAAGLVTQGEAADETSDWDGIVLLAAYPTAPITVPAILIYGTNDGIVEPEEYGRIGEDGLWPEDFTEVRLEGGNHAQFGDYGEQNGDNKAELLFDEQLDQTVAAITEWIEARR
jgi:pimeloyl-ACP methyl ester carboxylesterase